MYAYRQLEARNLPWRTRAALFLGIALVVAGVVALALVSLALAVIVLPIAAVALAIGRWRLSRLMAEARARARAARGSRPDDGRVIETDYSRVDGDR